MMEKLKRLWNDPLASYTYNYDGGCICLLGWKLYGKNGIGLLVEDKGWRVMLWYWQVFIDKE